jgi:hypothetical protein
VSRATFDLHGAPTELTFETIDGLRIHGGDMVLPSGRATDGRSLSLKIGTWPKGVIPYVIDRNVSGTLRSRIKAAIRHWQASTNIRLVARKREAMFVTFHMLAASDNRCYSTIGRPEDGPGGVWLNQRRCITPRVIHEIGHVVGLLHEQSRPDRDQYVRIVWANVRPDSKDNFEIVGKGQMAWAQGKWMTTGPYDFASVMHYYSKNYSRNGKVTVVRKDGSYIPLNRVLSDGDKATVAALYGWP